MSPDDPRSLQLDELTQVAHRLGMVFGQEAERAETHERRMEFFRLFDRCFFSVRVSIALQLRLGGEARRSVREVDRDEPERDSPEVDRPERFDERDRDHEVERASLTTLLRTLEGVAAHADALPGPTPAELPKLRELLARMKAEPALAATPPRSHVPALRARLTGSAATLTLPRPSPGLSPGPRRATGPP